MSNLVEKLREEAGSIAGDDAIPLQRYLKQLLVAAANRIEELEASQSNVVPAGWKLVPVEPTYEMRRKAGLTIGGDYYTISKIWKSMISASPKPPHGEEIHVNVAGDDWTPLYTKTQAKWLVQQLEWSQTLLDGEIVTLSDAEEAVAKLGAGWRLPTRQELESLLDLSRHGPAIDTSKYPDTENYAYWTSTPCDWDNNAHWVVSFGGGVVYCNYRSDYACVRAVRVEEGQGDE